ncbi:hypothetical protein J3B02_000083 [Coemansia erecta]|uniref:Uncharacterized protein n=1 Tax=Coemansia asiatica TaxID=1052880 RepID=A0A9W7XMA7_9FUNG|nr:hypothetical protein LPJ64_000871 [Coemansia asiatica]KAJ2858702.1 hypothetical protein J3B02_000083 [Coemansia erecta]KAJ2861129.1 hypothetical protein FB639_005537 [Coemansia asiatica]
MISTIKSVSSLSSELSEDRQTVASTSNTLTMPEDDICARLDRVNAWRLDRQCAALPSPPLRTHNSSNITAMGGAGGGMLELSDILHKASKLQAQRLSNQDFARKKPQLGPVRNAETDRETFLAGIARGLGQLGDEIQEQRSAHVHPRDHMRRVVLASVQRLHHMGTPALKRDI